MGNCVGLYCEVETAIPDSDVGAGAIPGMIRRVVSISLIATGFVTFVLAAPFLLLVMMMVDGLSRGRTTFVRAYLFLFSFFTLELIGVGAAFMLWLGRVLRLLSEVRYIRAHYLLQSWWAATLAKAAIGLFALRIEVDSQHKFGERPFVLFMRHASFADTVLPMVCIAIPEGLRLRYVLKRELLWDPCLDIVGQRLPNVFVTRDPEQGSADRALIRSLSDGMAEDEGIVIFPEGTRFSEAKRLKLIERSNAMERKTIAKEAESLRHVLPARNGGMLAALATHGELDAVFCAHTGLEKGTRFADLVNGTLRGARVPVAMWSIPAAAIPRTEREKCTWLVEQWRRVDEWITREKERNAP